MKIDESVIDKVLDNKAAPGEARKVAGWFVTEEGRKYLSGRLDREMEELIGISIAGCNSLLNTICRHSADWR